MLQMIKRELLQGILGESVRPMDLAFYNEAFIHKSASKSFGMSQERLEHLGDAVLSLCVCHMLYERHPRESEGVLTRMRTRLVNGKTLAIIGRAMGIEKGIVVDTLASNALYHDRIFEDTFEAIVGAVYLDQGLDAAKYFVATQYDMHINPDEMNQDTNYKDMIKKATHKTAMQAPRYNVTNNDGVFHCNLMIGNDIYGQGDGNTKKQSEMEAAHNAIILHFPEFQDQKINE
jgi:ribonuclease-3